MKSYSLNVKRVGREIMNSQGIVLRITNYGSRLTMNAHVAQLVEHVLGKDEVTRSIRVVGSKPRLIRPEANKLVLATG